jgi:hypothetical protein
MEHTTTPVSKPNDPQNKSHTITECEKFRKAGHDLIKVLRTYDDFQKKAVYLLGYAAVVTYCGKLFSPHPPVRIPASPEAC